MKVKFLSFVFILFLAQFAAAQEMAKKQASSVIQENLEQYKGNYVSDANPDVTLVYVQGDKLMLKQPAKLL